MANKAWLITHPKTKLDQQGRIHGRIDLRGRADPPLTYSGRVHAQQIGKSLKNRGIKRIHSSPRKRAVEMAQILSKHTGAPVEIHKELEPWNLASMSGAKTASIGPLLEFFSSRPERKIPGGESKNDVLARYKAFTNKLQPGDAVVGHSQHSLAWDYARKGGDAAKVPMVGGKAGEVREVNL